MSSNGHEPNGEGQRISFAEALASMGEPRDRLDKLAVFTATQTHALAEMIDKLASSTAEQDRQLLDVIKLLSRRVEILETELARSKGGEKETRQ